MRTILSLLLAALLAIFALTGCGGGGDDPATVVEQAMNAMISMDEEALTENVCDELSQQAGEALGMLRMSADEGATLELMDMQYTVTEESDDSAVVEVTGKVKGSHPEYGEMEDSITETMTVIREDGRWKVCQGFL